MQLKEKLREKRLIPNMMDEFDIAALLDAGGIKIWQCHSIQQCLKLLMGLDKVGVAERHLCALGVDHCEIKHGRTFMRILRIWPR